MDWMRQGLFSTRLFWGHKKRYWVWK